MNVTHGNKHSPISPFNLKAHASKFKYYGNITRSGYDTNRNAGINNS